MDLRVCNTCGEEKEITMFPKNGKEKDGSTAYRPDCKACYNIRRKLRAKEHNKFVSNTKHRTGEEQTFSLDDWRECMIHFRATCAYCGKEQSRSVKLTKDHVVPVSQGGLTVKHNMVPACVSCNCSKGNSDLETWYRKQIFFGEKKFGKIKRWLNGEY